MHRKLWILPLLAATAFSATASAQVDSHPAPDRKIVLLSDACPVGLAARQQASPSLQALVSLEDASTSAHPRPDDAGVLVSVNNPQTRVLTEARVVVFYIPAGTRLLPVSSTSTQAAPPQRQKTFTLTPGSTPASARRLSASLRVGPAASLVRVEVIGLTYADGATWQPTANQTCTVAINHVLLVDGQASKQAPKSEYPVWSEHIPVNPPAPWQGGSPEKPN